MYFELFHDVKGDMTFMFNKGAFVNKREKADKYVWAYFGTRDIHFVLCVVSPSPFLGTHVNP